jgi:hypothetical protein
MPVPTIRTGTSLGRGSSMLTVRIRWRGLDLGNVLVVSGDAQHSVAHSRKLDRYLPAESAASAGDSR